MLRSYLSALESGEDVIQHSLEIIRQHFDMDVAYLSEIVDGRSVFRRVTAPGLEHLIKEGDSNPLEDIYCGHIIAGRLPRLIPDTDKEPLARSMPVTSMVPIGAHLSIPIYLSDGALYGNFCCLSRKPNASLNERDLQIMEMFANLAVRQLSMESEERRRKDQHASHIAAIIAGADFDIVYQPIHSVEPMQVEGYEALCRFRPEPYRAPDRWFAEAAAAGRGVDLELAVLKKAVGALGELPPDVYLSLNASPATILSGRLGPALEGLPLDRLVLEITEHAEVADYGELVAALAPLREAGLRLAIDDAGAGYSSMQHIVEVAPDMIKLDISLTSKIDNDPVRRALAAALIFFARETGARMVAEGVETRQELETLKLLGIGMAQGFLLGRPAPLSEQLARRTGT